MLLQMLLAFLTSLFTGVTLRTPRAALLSVGLTGMLGWTTNEMLTKSKIPELVAAVSGALVVGTIAEIFARIQKQPVTVYIVSGIIPLVPGTISYNAMLSFLERRYSEGMYLAFRAFLIASYLAAGLAIMPLVARYFKGLFSRWEGITGKRNH